MKKLLGIVVLGLLLSGNAHSFFHNKKEKALETCADKTWLDRYNKKPSILKKLSKETFSKIYNHKDLSIAKGNIKNSKFNKKNATDNWENFARKTYTLNDAEISKWKGISWRLAMGTNREDIDDAPMLYLKDMINHDYEKKRVEFSKLFNLMSTREEQLLMHEIFLNDLMILKFTKLDIEIKFEELNYQFFYEDCERKHNELPSSFMKKWS